MTWHPSWIRSDCKGGLELDRLKALGKCAHRAKLVLGVRLQPVDFPDGPRYTGVKGHGPYVTPPSVTRGISGHLPGHTAAYHIVLITEFRVEQETDTVLVLGIQCWLMAGFKELLSDHIGEPVIGCSLAA